MIAIRAAAAADAAAIAAIYAPHVISGTTSFEKDPPDARAMRARMAASDGFYPWLVAVDGSDASGGDGGVIGYAHASRFRERDAYRFAVETEAYVADVPRREATGRLLYDALVDTLRAQRFTQAVARIALPNDASIRLLESVGYRRAGVYREVGYKHGRWIDVGLWQCELIEPTVPPAEPRPFSAVGLHRDPG